MRVCVSLREIVLYANFVHLSWLSKARKVRLTVEGTSIYKTGEGNSVRFFGMLMPTSIVVASLTNEDNSIG